MQQQAHRGQLRVASSRLQLAAQRCCGCQVEVPTAGAGIGAAAGALLVLRVAATAALDVGLFQRMLRSRGCLGSSHAFIAFARAGLRNPPTPGSDQRRQTR